MRTPMPPQKGSPWFVPAILLIVSPLFIGAILLVIGIAAHTTALTIVGVVLLVVTVLEQTVLLPLWKVKIVRRAEEEGLR